MQWRVSSSLATITSLFPSFAGDLVVAQVDAPSCTDFESSWEWSFNSLDQNPCLVSAHLMATCYGGAFIVGSLLGVGDSYSSPTVKQVQEANSCWCSTVILSLISACGECQRGLSKSWTQFSQNCTGIIKPSTFLNPVPVGTRVPQWALLDITRTNIWSATAARNVGDTPEILPGALIRTSSGGGPNTGAIAGGVAGGVIVMAAVAGLVFAFWRRRRRVQKPSATTVVEDAQPPSALQLGQVHSVPSYGHTQVPHWQAMLNGANNMTTYPQQQEGVLTSTPNGNNPNNMQPLRLPVQGYHGLPTV